MNGSEKWAWGRCDGRGCAGCFGRFGEVFVHAMGMGVGEGVVDVGIGIRDWDAVLDYTFRNTMDSRKQHVPKW